MKTMYFQEIFHTLLRYVLVFISIIIKILFHGHLFSLNLSTILQKNGRIYKVGGRSCEIHEDVLNKLLE